MIRKFESFQIGETAKFDHVITNEDVRKFVEITGDDNPLHVDVEFAKKTSFKNVVTHGMLSASFVSTMVGKHLPGDGALWMSQSIDFLLPVRLGDRLTIFGKVVELIPRERVLHLEVTISNQHKQTVLVGTCKVKLLQLEVEISPNIIVEKVKNVIVTGASKGIGAETALQLANSGYKVVVNYFSDESGANDVVNRIRRNGGTGFAFRADVSSEEDVKKMFAFTRATIGSVSHLVNNASSKILTQDFQDLVWEDFLYQLDTQLKGAFLCAKEAIAHMRELGYGSIVNVGSMVTDNVPTTKWTTYNVAKTALTSLSKNLANEFGPKGIRVNTISPGLTATNLTSDIPQKQMKLYAAQTPLRRLSEPAELAKSIAFLLGDDAGFINGENLRINGGKIMM